MADPEKAKIGLPELFQRLKELYPLLTEIRKGEVPEGCDDQVILVNASRNTRTIMHVEIKVQWPDGVTVWPPAIGEEWRKALPSDLDNGVATQASIEANGKMFFGTLLGYRFEKGFEVEFRASDREPTYTRESHDVFVPRGANPLKFDHMLAIGAFNRLLDKLEPTGVAYTPSEIVKRITKWIDGYKEELETARKEVAYLRTMEGHRDAVTRRDYWAWHGDGSDNLHSLSCRVVLWAHELRQLIHDGDRQESIRKRFQDVLGDRLTSGTWEDIWENVRTPVREAGAK